jgi:hypothetical protein
MVMMGLWVGFVDGCRHAAVVRRHFTHRRDNPLSGELKFSFTGSPSRRAFRFGARK